ncbi:MAG: flavin monoamine oxidase family protein, partial [Archangium sp.]
LGAEFLHGLPRKLNLPHRFSLRPRDADGEHWVVDARGLRQADDAAEAAMNLLGEMTRADTTADAWLAEHTKGSQRRLARQFVSGFYAANPRTVSTQFLVEESEGSEDVHGDRMFRPTRGYDTLVHHLAKEVNAHLSTVVTKVRWKRERVDVEARDALGHLREYRAKKVVIALPLGVLKARTIHFSPALDGLQLATKHLEVGPIVKMVLRFREAFWAKHRAKNFTMLHFVDGPQQAWWRCAPFDSPVLVGWSAGPQAKKKPTVAHALHAFERAFRMKNLSRLLDASLVVDWAADPFACGGYMVQPVGLPRPLQELFAPVDDTIFFAGEHTSFEGHAGTVHGAVWTGQRAAREVTAP